MSRQLDLPNWWTSLNHGGLLIAPSKLRQSFPEEPPPLSNYHRERLRRAVVRFMGGDGEHLSALLDRVLQEVLGHDGIEWQKGPDVAAEWSQRLVTGETLKPRRVWQGANGSRLPVFVADARGIPSRGKPAARLGVGRGRRVVARVVEWLRRSGQKLALLTNGRQWRLMHAGPDYEAWCEWDVELWFQEGEPGPQVTALRLLLGPDALRAPSDGEDPPLLAAVLASRKGQAELSSVLGERVRRAVEHLIQVSSVALEPIDAVGPGRVPRQDIYIAACRVVMRCVVLLFAEARDLLPRDNPIYHGSYGLVGLREQLDRQAGGHGRDRLRHSHGAWPRLLALFRLVYEGSSHEALPIPRYGGALFQPGNPEASSPILRALAALESPTNTPHDGAVSRILELLTRSRVKVRQGNRNIWVEAPVDFSDLSSEFIGILYEGLLDFELRRVGKDEDDAMVFLNLGDQPALPLLRLSGMTPKESKALLEKLKSGSQKLELGEDEEDEEDKNTDDGEEAEESEDLEEEAEEESDEDDEDEPTPEEDETEEENDRDLKRDLSERVEVWARRAVREAKLVKYPKDDSDPRVRDAYEQQLNKKAKSLIQRVILPGDWFLVRWGGTRKGSGTFYTPPQLARPTVRRTLQTLAYEAITEETDEKTGLVTVTEWRPRKPEEILALKVCDPAMGSGSFLVSALRFLTDALVESLYAHDRLEPRHDGTIVKLADGLPLEHPSQETLPVPPEHEEFEAQLRARLRRHVVERCIYGVDQDPLAVELGRMALWVETMDPRLPFGFLDHKLKCGNSLVGCWLDRFQDYPVMAWEREGGDKNHDHFVHHFREHKINRGKRKGEIVRKGDVWTKAIKDVRNGVVKVQMVEWIRLQRDDVLPFVEESHQTPQDVHADALAAFEALHRLPVHEADERERLYRDQIQEDPDFQSLRAAFNTWCAVWFWPADQIDIAPTPLNFLNPPSPVRSLVKSLAERERFFHWELEFPDAFNQTSSGFDALVGNPPWEIQKPNSKEFFSNVDPLYRTYGKQEAFAKQMEYFVHSKDLELDWLHYRARLRSMSNWTKHAAYPFGDPSETNGEAFNLSRSIKTNARLHSRWSLKRQMRKGYADDRHPFAYQGSADVNTYKLFMELTLSIAATGGQFGLVLPSGIYSDKGSTRLRRLLLFACEWKLLFGFENRLRIFPIDSRFKFCVIIGRKGGATQALKTSFMNRSLETWEAKADVLVYSKDHVDKFSPLSKSILEIRVRRDLEILDSLYDRSVLLGGNESNGWGVRYKTEFHMTNDSKLFKTRPEWEKRGYKLDEYGHWLRGDWRPLPDKKSILRREPESVLSSDGTYSIMACDIEGISLPVFEGRMIGQFDFSQKGWVRGKGRSAVWRDLGFEGKMIEPQFCMSLDTYASARDQRGNLKSIRGYKLGFMDIGSATNARTMVATLVPDFPCGNKVPVIQASQAAVNLVPALLGILNSFAYDYALRCRLSGLTLNYFIIRETPVAEPKDSEACSAIANAALNLSAGSLKYSPLWLLFRSANVAWQARWAVTVHERLRLRTLLDAIAAYLLGFDEQEFRWILAECDYPKEFLSSAESSRQLNPKGFWRVGKDVDPELRHTILSLVAFHELNRLGLEDFLRQNSGEGWMLPRTIRLSDYGLGRDSRAREPQPVAARLGPRFHEWQLEKSVEESWEECELHADLIAQIVPAPQKKPSTVTEPKGDHPPVDLFGNPLDTDLFGNVLPPTRKRRRR